MADDHDQHDKHLVHQMDTNGFTGHDSLREKAEKRFITAALAYCAHVESGAHAECPEICPYALGMMDAHQTLMSC